MSELDGWLADVATAALVGTARREPPAPPGVLGLAGDPEEPRDRRLLASAAVVDAISRGGATLAPVRDSGPTSPPESLPPCGDAAAQLLRLLLTQPPVSKDARDSLVVEWLRLADDAGQRVPWALLPVLLDFAVPRPRVARGLSATIGERGTWLMALNPAWSGLLTPDEVVVHEAGADWAEVWPTLSTAEAIASYAVGRRADPVVARTLLEAHWDTVSAKVRAEALQTLRWGLSLDDEPLLERALDDRASSVRDAAARVLAGLPQGALAARMADRLRALVHVRGAVVRHLEVDVPDPPDEAAIRDGLTAPATGARATPGLWLAQVIGAAPLETWTDITGRSVAATLKMVRDKDVLAHLLLAVLARGDQEWATAYVDIGSTDPRLLALLPEDARTRLVVSRVQRPPAGRELPELLGGLSRPWPDEVGRAVLRGLASNALLAQVARPLLPQALNPSLGPEIRAALDRIPEDATHLRRSLTETLQLHAFRTSLTEAFR